MIDNKSGQFNLRRIIFSYGFYIVLVAVFIIYSLGATSFLTISNLANILRDIAPLLVIASGLTLVIVTGSLDISVGSIALASAAAGIFLTSRLQLSTPAMILIALAVGTCLGAINGFLIVVLRINALVTTLGMMIALRGVGLDLLGGSQWMVPDALVDFTRLKVGPIYSGTIVALVIAGVAQVVLTRTVFGRHLAAIGNSPVIAARLGVRVRLTTFAVFVLSGFLASAGGILTAAHLAVVHPYLGQGLEFLGVAAVVVGGTSLFGGEGSVIPGTLIGVITLTLIENGLNLMGASPFVYPFVRGLIIFTAMYADSLRAQLHGQTRRIVTEATAVGAE